MALRSHKVSGAFEKRAPGSQTNKYSKYVLRDSGSQMQLSRAVQYAERSKTLLKLKMKRRRSIQEVK